MKELQLRSFLRSFVPQVSSAKATWNQNVHSKWRDIYIYIYIPVNALQTTALGPTVKKVGYLKQPTPTLLMTGEMLETCSSFTSLQPAKISKPEKSKTPQGPQDCRSCLLHPAAQGWYSRRSPTHTSQFKLGWRPIKRAKQPKNSCLKWRENPFPIKWGWFGSRTPSVQSENILSSRFKIR